MLSMVSVAFERMGLSDARACIPTTWQTMILEPSGFGGWKPSTSILSTCLMLHSISLVFGSRSLSGGDHIAQEAHTQTHKQLHLRLDLRSVTSIGAAKLVCAAGHMTKFTTRLRYANKMFATINTKVQLSNHAFIQTSTRKKMGIVIYAKMLEKQAVRRRGRASEMNGEAHLYSQPSFARPLSFTK